MTALQDLAGLYREHFELGEIGMAVASADRRWLLVNERLCAILGCAKEELLRRAWTDCLHDGDRAEEELQYARLIGGEMDSAVQDLRFVRCDGETVYTRFSVTAIRAGKSGEVDRLIVQVQDVTSSKLAEEALRTSEATLRSVFLAAPIGIGMVENRILGWTNEQLTEMTGYSPSELKGRSSLLLYENEDEFERVGIEKYAQVRVQGTGSVETRWVKKNGNVIDVFLSSTPIDPDSPSGAMVFTATDITERKRAEGALRHSEENYRSLVRNAVFGIYRSSRDGRLLDVNPALVEILGYDSREELIGKSIPEHVCVAPADFQALEDVFAELDMIEGLDVQWRMKDGTPLTVRLSGRPIRNEKGEFHCWEMIVEDVTAKRMLEDHLRQSQKLEAIGQLAGGVAHDFNNLLTAINGYSGILLDAMPENDPYRVKIKEIARAGERASGLTRQLLAFSRKQILMPRVIDLNEVVRGMENMLIRLIGEDIHLTTILDPELGRVKADVGQIEQVILNLVVNSRDAMPEGGEVTVRTSGVVFALEAGEAQFGLPPGRYARITVSDTGCGMDRETRDRIFEPFFTTKGRDRGTGLGLATVYGIVTQSGGVVRVTSEVGLGSAFDVYLPIVAETEEPPQPLPEQETPEAHDGMGTVLIVEDEGAVRDLAQEVLELSGYDVLSASCADEAFRVSEETKRPIDVLLSDVVLPGPSGPEIAEELSMRRPRMRIIFMSGYTDDTVLKRGGQGGADFLQKPFTPDDLLDAVRQALEVR